ncbi:branched-chain amino acid ABC transporter permease [Azospirillum sp. 412522]|nr:branched-chain amino acid ABC transporter permease [Azospirillum sp. 412522]MBY6264443.1 branched-chain amino acid ABC transporter permease [Azospirillum sp. 412522]
MTLNLIIEQVLNGCQLGVMLFMMSAGLTLVFGIMNLINLAHGSLYMIGAYVAASVLAATGSFLLAVLVAVPAAAAVGYAVDRILLRHFYRRSHLDQTLATFGLILAANELVRMIWGATPLAMPLPSLLAGSVSLLPDLQYPVFRLVVLAVGLVMAGVLYVLVTHTRGGMWVRAGASDRTMAAALGIDVSRVFSVVFVAGAALAGLAGVMAGPILAVQVGMGEPILILALVVVVVGGLGSIRGAFVAALLIGLGDTFGRVLLHPALGSMAIYVIMAALLALRPGGLFPSHA